MGIRFFDKLSNMIASSQEKTELSRESSAIIELSNAVADYKQIKPERDKAKVNATQLRTILDRQTDKAKISDIENLEAKEVKQFERKVTRQLWDLKRILFNLNIIIRTEHHEMLLEVHKPLRSYSLLLEEFGNVFSKEKNAGVTLNDKQRETISKYFELIRDDYNILVNRMVELSKHELTPVVNITNDTITADHMRQRSTLRKELNQKTMSIRTKFLAISKELRKVSKNPASDSLILITCLNDAKQQFEVLLKLFTDRGSLAKEMVKNSEMMRANTLREIRELQLVLDQFYVSMASNSKFQNKKVSEDENKILAQLRAWELRNKDELSKDAAILAAEEQDDIKNTEQMQLDMRSMNAELVKKTALITETVKGLNAIGGETTGWDGQTIQAPPPKNLIKDPSTNLLNQNGLHTDTSRILTERPAAFDAPKTGVLGRLRKGFLTNVMAGLMAFNIFAPATIHAIKQLPPIVRSTTISQSNYYEEEITINITKSEKSYFIFSHHFDSSEGMVSDKAFEQELNIKTLEQIGKPAIDSLAKDKFGNDSITSKVTFNAEKSSIIGGTDFFGTSRNVDGKNNDTLKITRAVQALKKVDKVIRGLEKDSLITQGSKIDLIKIDGTTTFDDQTVADAVTKLNEYAESIGRKDLIANPALVRQKNMIEVKKADDCVLLMSKDKSESVKTAYAAIKQSLSSSRRADVKLVFTIQLTKVPKADTYVPPMFAPVSGPERMVKRTYEATEEIVPTPKKQKHPRPKNDPKLKNLRNVDTNSGALTRNKYGGNTTFYTSNNHRRNS